MWNSKITDISKLRIVVDNDYDSDGYVDSISDDLECKGIENYDMTMGSHINYLAILYNHAIMYKQIWKKVFYLIKKTKSSSNWSF